MKVIGGPKRLVTAFASTASSRLVAMRDEPLARGWHPIELLDAHTFKRRAQLRGHGAFVGRLFIRHDGKLVNTSELDVRIWSLP